MEHQAEMHPIAPHNLPFYITAPEQTDGLFVAMGITVLLIVIGIGILYFKLHALPEHMAHRGQKVQFEIVAVLALLALFTHNHAFWIAGLLLALIPFPDFTTPLTSMAQSLGKMARRSEPAGLAPRDAPAISALPPAQAQPLPVDDRPIEHRRT